MADVPHVSARLARLFSERRAREPAVEEAREAQREEAAGAVCQPALLVTELRMAGAPAFVVDLFESHAFRASELGVRRVDEFLASPATFLVLTGAVGCGKTTAACYALTRVRHGFCLEAPALVFCNPWGDEGSKLLHRARTCELLVLNELAEKATGDDGRWQQKLDYLLDSRHASKRKTLITTNLTAQALRAEYGPRIWDRLRTGHFVGCGNASLRRPAGGP